MRVLTVIPGMSGSDAFFLAATMLLFLLIALGLILSLL